MMQKVLEGDPEMKLIQLDAKRGNVNDIVNDSIRSSYQVHMHCCIILFCQAAHIGFECGYAQSACNRVAAYSCGYDDQ